jgi:hypothetical protein
LEGDHAATTNALDQPTQHGQGILNEEKHAAANHGVEVVVEGHRGRVTNSEGHVFQASRVSALSRCRQKLHIGVNANDCAVPSYNVGDNECDVARAASHIENLHSGQDACILEKAPRVRAKHLRLAQQAVGLSL